MQRRFSPIAATERAAPSCNIASRFIAWARTAGERRHARLVLSSMSDRELKDIGLVRSHIETIVYAPRR